LFAKGKALPPKGVPIPNAAGVGLPPNPLLLPIGVPARSEASEARARGHLELEGSVADSDFCAELKLGVAWPVAAGLQKGLGEDSLASVTTFLVAAAKFGPNSTLIAGEPNFRGSDTIDFN
jgi:hypothetical protein